MAIYMSAIVAIFALLLLVGNKFGIKNQFDDYLSIESTKGTRGVLAVMILLHHLSFKVEEAGLLKVFNFVGYLVVGVFLFYSGYGLLLQVQKKREAYLKSFWLSRIMSLVAVYCLYIVIYGVGGYIVDNDFSIKAFLLSFINGNPAVTSSWYIIAQIILYILFWIAFSIKAKDNRVNIGITFALTLVLIVVFNLIGYPDFWSISLLAFSIGMLWAYYKEAIDKVLSTKFVLAFGVAVVGFGAFFVIPKLLEHFGMDNYWITVLVKNIASMLFAIVIILANRIIKFSSKLWKILGDASLEIYLIQGIVYLNLSNVINNKLIFVVLSIVVTIAVAIPLSKLDKVIMKLFK